MPLYTGLSCTAAPGRGMCVRHNLLCCCCCSTRLLTHPIHNTSSSSVARVGLGGGCSFRPVPPWLQLLGCRDNHYVCVFVCVCQGGERQQAARPVLTFSPTTRWHCCFT